MKIIFLGLLLFFAFIIYGINDVSHETILRYESNNYNNDCNCENTYEPVCGINNITYGNKCLIACDKIDIQYEGECK